MRWACVALLRIKNSSSFLLPVHWDKITPKSWQKYQFLVNFYKVIPPKKFLPKKSLDKDISNFWNQQRRGWKTHLYREKNLVTYVGFYFNTLIYDAWIWFCPQVVSFLKKELCWNIYWISWIILKKFIWIGPIKIWYGPIISRKTT